MRPKSRFLIPGIMYLALTFAPVAEAQKVTEDTWQHLRVEFTTGDLQVAETELSGTPYSTLTVDGYLPSSAVGEPCLPVWTSLLEVPFCSGYEVTVSGAEYDTVDAATLGMRHLLLPTQPSRSKSDTQPHAPVVGKAYSRDAYYQVALAQVEPVGIARDRQLARLEFSPVSYNPVSGKLIVCRRATVEVRYRGADREGTLAHYERYHTPAYGAGTQVLNNLYPKSVNSDAPVRYLIVAHSMFRGQLDSFVQWKRKKGFIVDVAYTDSSAVGTTTTSIRNYILSQYNASSPEKPAPTYLLLVGDHEQLPAFAGTTDDDHITDLYYTTWTTGDNIPDCYHGRFSAQTVAQLTPQIQKTLMYEQYTFANPSFLDRAVMVAGVDGGASGDHGYTRGDPAIDYAIVNYINGAHGFSNVYCFKNNTSIVPAGATNVSVESSSYSMSETVRNRYNQGAGLINYTAHGSPTSWGTPELNTTQVNQMTNNQKFGLMIGNCCQTNKFQTESCLGEALLRKGNYAGAVGYIGASNSTYWNEDFYWAVGVRSSMGPSMSMAYQANNRGAYDYVMHTHGEPYSQWAISQGALMFAGNMAVESSTAGSNTKLYYWEIYHLMGDPSVMTYLTQADVMPVAVPPAVAMGTLTLPVSAVPYAYVALIDTVNQQLLASTFADGNGDAQLTLPNTLLPGTYQLACSAQQYRTAFTNITVIQPTGPYAIISQVQSAPLNAGDTVALTLHFENLGTVTAHNIVAHLASGNPMLALSVDSVVLDSLAAGASADLPLAVTAYVSPLAPDNSSVNLLFNTTWDGDTLEGASLATVSLYAPVIAIRFSQPDMNILPGSDAPMTVFLHNSGHAPMQASPLTVTSPTSLLAVTMADNSPLTLAPTGTVSIDMTLHADTLLPNNITVPLRYRYGNLDIELPVFIGESYMESFESGSILIPGVTNNSNLPWVVVNSDAFAGSYCLRSAPNLNDYDTSRISFSVLAEANDSVKFYYRVSSEGGYDKFHFLIDGEEQFQASGETDWALADLGLTPGQHTLTFAYSKDVSVSAGSDCAWVDNLVLPHQTETAHFLNDTVCSGSTYAPLGEPVDTHEPGSGSLHGVLNGEYLFIEYTILPTFTTVDSVVSCNSYTWNNIVYTADGTYTRLFPSSNGCADTAILVLTLHHSVSTTVVDTVEGDSYQWNGSVYTTSGEYQTVLSTVDGCDSIVTLMLTLIDSTSEGIPTSTPHASLSLYPNPSTGLVSLSERADEVWVYDLQGREMAHLKEAEQIDLGHLPQGVYTLRVSTAQGTATLRLVRKD